MGKSTYEKPVISPAWTSQVGHEALSCRIVHDREHDRNAAGRLFECGNDRRPGGCNHIGGRGHQFRDVLLDASNIATGKPMLDLNVAVFHPSEGRKPFSKGSPYGPAPLGRSQRARARTPRAARGRAAAPRLQAATPTAAPPRAVMNSAPSHHSITSSAMASSVSGRSSPSKPAACVGMFGTSYLTTECAVKGSPTNVAQNFREGQDACN